MESDPSNIICAACRKPKSENSGASITALMFESAYCSCDSQKPADKHSSAAEMPRCPHCGLVKASATGSITSLLFDELCCQCSAEKPLNNRDKRAPNANDLEGLNPQLDRADPKKAFPEGWDSRLISYEDACAMLELHSGDMVGAYRISKLIGRGGMGIVYLASHLALNRTCALKFLAPSLVTSVNWTMFQNEAKTIAALTHATICQIYDLGIHKGNLPFYAMEYVPGQTLAAVLSQNGPLAIERALEIFSKMAAGLDYAHSHGVVHKDIKPANIMLIPAADGTVEIKILDFGIAELIDSGDERQNLPALGTAYYMSPEQFKGAGVDQRSDIYSLGCSMFEMLTGRPPYSGSRSELSFAHAKAAIPRLGEQSDEEFPLAIEAIVRKCLSKSPEKRYQNADQLVCDLALVNDNQPLQFAQDELNELKTQSDPSLSKSQISGLSPNMTVAVVLVAVTLLIIGGYRTVVSYVDNAETAKLKEIEKRKRAELARRKAAAARETVDTQAVLNKANAAFLQKRFGDVVALVDDAFTKGASNAQLFLMRGMSFAQLEQPDRAISDLEKARKLEPALNTNVFCNDCLAKNYAALSDNTRALSAIDRSIAINPDSERLRLKAHILCQLGRYADARDLLTQAMKLASDKYWLYFDRGSCSASLNQHEKAVEDFTNAIRLRPGEPGAYGSRARSYARLGKTDLSKKDVEHSQQLGLPEWNYFESQGSQKE